MNERLSARARPLSPDNTLLEPAALRPLLILLFALCAPTLVFWSTAWSMGIIWSREETYAHGFLVVPFVLFMAWRTRESLARVPLRPSAAGFIALAGCGFGWLAASVASVAVGTHFMLVAMCWSLVLALGGWGLLKALSFPLGFLIFAVPFGQAFVPALIDFTADFTVGMLRLTGVPVFREGTYFTIPTGQWSVVDACSGIRYLLASLMLGTLYAYLNYTRVWKRGLFIVLSAVVPILANGMRAYLIVMIGHLSSNQLAHGVDHFIYGWVWFGIVCGLLFWVGSYWRDPVDADTPDQAAGAPADGGKAPLRTQLLTGLLAVATLAVWPVWEAGAVRAAATRAAAAPAPTLPASSGDWRQVGTAFTSWKPEVHNADTRLQAVYAVSDPAVPPVSLDVGHYTHSRDEAELVNINNVLLHRYDERWRRVGGGGTATGLSAPARVEEAHLRSREGEILAWRWYHVGGRHLASDSQTKALEALLRLAGADTRGYHVVVYTPLEGERREHLQRARQRLGDFVSENLAAVERTLGGDAAQGVR